VREDHSTGAASVVNTIVSLSVTPQADPSPEVTLVEGNDFYAAPRLSPSGSQLCWLTWNHPRMPWDGTELWIAELADDGGLKDARKLAGGDQESIFQPAWSPNGILYFVSDRNNWWNLYRWRAGRVEAVIEQPVELGTAQWLFGMATYAFESEQRIVCQVRSKGAGRIAVIDPEAGRLQEVATPYTAFSAFIQARSGQAVTIAGSPTEPVSLIAVQLDPGRVEVLRRSAELVVDPKYISVPEAIEFPTEGGVTAHGFFYPPKNPDYAPPAGELPPLIVYVHGGPTSAVSNALDLADQFWTTRGFA